MKTREGEIINCEAERTWKVYPSHWTNSGHNQYNNLERFRKKDLLSNKCRCIVRAVKKDPKTTVSDWGQVRSEGITIKSIAEHFMNKITEATLEDESHSSAWRIARSGWTLPKNTEMSLKPFVPRLYGLMRPRITFTKVMEMLKFGGKRGSAYHPKHTSSSVKHGGGNVMAWAWVWACMASSGTGSLILINKVESDGSSKINSTLQKHFVCQFKEKCKPTDWGTLLQTANIL